MHSLSKMFDFDVATYDHVEWLTDRRFVDGLTGAASAADRLGLPRRLSSPVNLQAPAGQAATSVSLPASWEREMQTPQGGQGHVSSTCYFSIGSPRPVPSHPAPLAPRKYARMMF